MANDRKPSIRPVSRNTRKVRRLNECSCLDEVERRLRLGWASQKIAEYIQNDAGELVDVPISSLRKMIDEYRKTIPPSELALTSQNFLAQQKANRRAAEGFNELEELEKLYQLQMKRIEIDVGNEEKINKLLPTTGREIFYAMKLLKQSSDLKMDLGLATRQLGEVSLAGQSAVQISNRYNGGVGQVLTDPDSRRKVLSMVESLMSVASKAHIDAGEIINSAVSVSGADVIDVESRERTADGDDSGDSSDSDGDSED